MESNLALDVLTIGAGALAMFLIGQTLQNKILANRGIALVTLLAFFVLLIFAPLMCAGFAFGLLFPRQALSNFNLFQKAR